MYISLRDSKEWYYVTRDLPRTDFPPFGCRRSEWVRFIKWHHPWPWPWPCHRIRDMARSPTALSIMSPRQPYSECILCGHGQPYSECILCGHGYAGHGWFINSIAENFVIGWISIWWQGQRRRRHCDCWPWNLGKIHGQSKSFFFVAKKMVLVWLRVIQRFVTVGKMPLRKKPWKQNFK